MTVVEPGGARGDLSGPSAGSRGEALDPLLERDLADLRAALEGHPFPAQQDDLIAFLLGRQEPVRLCCRLSRLPHAAVYVSLDEVVEAVELAAAGEAADGQACDEAGGRPV